MNLICCDQNCLHQKDGYCALNHITQLSGSNQGGCGYYRAAPQAGPAPHPLPDEGKGLG